MGEPAKTIAEVSHPPCEICGTAVGELGHRCETELCYGTYLRAIRILATRAYPPDQEPYLQWSVDTLGRRVGRPESIDD